MKRKPLANPSADFPLVYCEWHDAYANGGWVDRGEYQNWVQPRHMTVHQVGWLLQQDKECVVIASRFNPAAGKYGEFQMIPKTWCKVRVLAKASKGCR
jgi:hypothetical protein